MDKRLIAMIGAAAVAGAASTPAGAAPNPVQDVLHVTSYADLLKPVPNAQAALRELDAAHDAQTSEREQVAQYFYNDDHHHHHSNYRRYRGDDHHHHHSNYYGRRRDFDGYGHHHHHHHHNSYYRY